MIRDDIVESGYRTWTVTIVMTLTNPEVYSKEEIAELYGFRWNVELDIRSIKQSVILSHARCKSPAMVRIKKYEREKEPKNPGTPRLCPYRCCRPTLEGWKKDQMAQSP